MRPCLQRRNVLEAAALLALGLALGLTFNARLLLTAWTTPPAPPPAAPAVSPAYPVPVLLADVQALLARGAVAVDARSAEHYAAGHLPGALSLPLEQAADPAKLSHLPTGTTLVVYCSGYGCSDSFDLAVALLAAGYTDVRVFEGGYPEWHDAGLPVESKP